MAKAKAEPAAKRPLGRPSTYNEKTATLICNLISCGMSIRKICAENTTLPDPTTIYKWLSEQPSFSQQYARAREDASAFMAEELLDIVDNESGDTIEIETKNGTQVVANHAKVQRDRLRADTRKWLLSKLAPKKYGEPKTPLDTAEDGKVAIDIKGGLPK